MDGITLAFISLITWSISDIIVKLALNKSSWWKVLFYTQLAGGSLMLIIASFTTELNQIFTGLGLLLILLGLIDMIGFLTMYKSIHSKGVSLTAPIINSWAIVSVTLSMIFYGERISFLQLIAILCIIFGIFIVTLKKEKFHFDKTFTIALISMLTWGVFFFLLKIPNLVFNAILVTAAVKLLTLPFSLPLIFKKKINLLKTKTSVLLIIILAGILDAAGFLAFNSALKISPVSLISPIIAAAPVLIAIMGVFFLKEKISKRQTIGIIITVLGLITISL